MSAILFKFSSHANLQEILIWNCYLISVPFNIYEGWNFNSGNYLFTTDTK